MPTARFPIFLTLFLLLALAPARPAVAEQVVTLYFGGTTMTSVMSDPAQSPFKRSEVVAHLYADQRDRAHGGPANHHKLFINGIGTGSGLALDLLQASSPSFDLLRGWSQVLNEAITFINGVYASTGDTIRLNLVGFSRGGISTFMVAHWERNVSWVTRINIFAFDPVRGDDLFTLHPDYSYDMFTLGPKVKIFVGSYAEDERSLLFKPLVPGVDRSRTLAWMFRTAGSHETGLGNSQVDGRSTYPLGGILNPFEENASCYWILFVPICHEVYDDDVLARPGQASVAMAKEVLSSPQWGGLRFATDWMTGSGNRWTWLKGRIDGMWDYDDAYMRKVSFVPGLLESYRNELLFGTGCWPFEVVIGGAWPFYLQNQPRCLERFTAGSQQIRGLQLQGDIPCLTGTAALAVIRDLDQDGVLSDTDNCLEVPNPDQDDADRDGVGDACTDDDDSDGVLDTVDNCPRTANPTQTDTNGDGVGDACEVDTDFDGVANGTDNCPLVPNPDQANLDGDTLGDACDPDLDQDSWANGVDNCPWTANPDQADADGDGLGDAYDLLTLAAVTDLRARAKDTKVNVAWTPVDGASAYSVTRSVDGGDAEYVGTTTTSVYVDLAVEVGITYCYQVAPVDELGFVTAPSDPVCVTPTARVRASRR